MCKKLLGYALGRKIELGDSILLREMFGHLKNNNYKFSSLITDIVMSKQFRYGHGKYKFVRKK